MIKTILNIIKQFKYSIASILINCTIVITADYLLQDSNSTLQLICLVILLVATGITTDKLSIKDLTNQGFKRVVINGVTVFVKYTKEELNKAGYEKALTRKNKEVFVKVKED